MKYSFICSEPYNKLSDFLSDSIVGVGKSGIARQIKSGEVKVNGVKVREDIPVKIGDNVTAFFPEFAVRKTVLDIVYSDDNIIIFNKPANVNFDQIPKLYGDDNLIAAHRLDRNTCGLIVFAKTVSASQSLNQAFKSRTVTKLYHAVVSPPPDKAEDSLKAYIKKEDRYSVVSDKKLEGFSSIQTDYKTLAVKEDKALIEVNLITGKTHQIRAHMAFIGSPVCGDGKYASRQVSKMKSDGQMLCAVSIAFNKLSKPLEYLNGKSFKIVAPFDADFID